MTTFTFSDTATILSDPRPVLASVPSTDLDEVALALSSSGWAPQRVTVHEMRLSRGASMRLAGEYPDAHSPVSVSTDIHEALRAGDWMVDVSSGALLAAELPSSFWEDHALALTGTADGYSRWSTLV